MDQSETASPKSVINRWILLAGIVFLVTIIATKVHSDQRFIEKVREVATKSNISALQSATVGYQLEYGRHPSPSHKSDFINAASGDFILCLMGYDTKTIPNSQEISFIDPRLVGKPKNGFHEPNATFYDPWGIPYQVQIDSNYDSHLTNPESSTEILKKSVLVWSAGPDKDLTTWKDNITSWR